LGLFEDQNNVVGARVTPGTPRSLRSLVVPGARKRRSAAKLTLFEGLHLHAQSDLFDVLFSREGVNS